MSGSTKIALPEADIGSVNVYNKPKSDDYISIGRTESIGASSDTLDAENESPMLRQDTFYADSTIQNRSFERMSELENLDTIEDEEFETEELTDEVVQYRPRTLLESVDTILSILDDLGDRYNKWKYGNNGIYRFYCHKYNLTKIDSSRPYYTKILSQLNTMNNMSLHLLSSHYQKMSDSAVYSSNEVVDTVLCQLDEFVSCYCCKNCAFAISKKGAHVCSDLKANHTCLKWKNASSSERFLTVSRPQQSNKTQLLEKTKSTDKICSSEKAKYLNKTKSVDRNTSIQTQSSDSIQDLDSSTDKQKQEENLDKIETDQRNQVKNMTGSCFIREMGYYDQCVMEYFSERGIMHNFSHPYRKGEETTFIHSFLRAVVCHNCGRFCRCRCQRKIFRTVRNNTDGSIDLTQFNMLPSGLTNGAEYKESYNKIDNLERNSMNFVNGVYEQFHKEYTSSDPNLESSSENRTVNGMAPLDVNTLYSHTLNTGFGKVQFLMNMDCDVNKSKKIGINKNNVTENSSYEFQNTNKSTFEDSIAINALKGSKIDSSMGSVYYSNLFKGTSCKVTVEEIFTIVNNVPFTSIPEELLNYYKKVEWYELYRSPWWCLDDKFDDPKYFEDKGNLEAYVVKVLDALGYLGNLRYDAPFKVIGVGYYRKKICYWRYFYVNKNLWECFRDSVEYFIMISTLPNDVYLDSKISSWVTTHKGVQKRFPLLPSLLKSYRNLITFIKIGLETTKESKHTTGSHKNKELRDQHGHSDHFKNQKLKYKHNLKEDYGVYFFDITKVGEYECSVADVIGVALKRKLVSSGDGCTPRRQYIQKATTITPTVKVKLDPEMIYKGIFATNPGNITNTNTNSTGNSFISNTNVTKQGTNISNSLSSSATSSISRTDNKLSNVNNLNFKSTNNNNKNKKDEYRNNESNMGSDTISGSMGVMPNSNTNNINNNGNVERHLVNGIQKSSQTDSTNNSNNNVNNTNTNSSSNTSNDDKDMSNTDVSIDLKLNNLNTILSHYPDVCAQYSAITRQANDLKVQMSLLMSDINKVNGEQINQSCQEINLLNDNNMNNNNEFNKDYRNGLDMNKEKINSIKNDMLNNTNNSNNINSVKYELNNSVNTNHIKLNQDKGNDLDERYELVNGKLGSRLLDKIVEVKRDKIKRTNNNNNMNNNNNNEIEEFSTDDEHELKELPMFDVCYNNRNNSWSCLLEVVPCLVCPLECERNGSCLHYTQGKKLIETICNRMKPCDVKYTVHPHFRTDIHPAHKGGRPEISVISFSVNQYGHERARLLASQLKATYKIQALNSMLINMACNSNMNNNNNFINNTVNNSNDSKENKEKTKVKEVENKKKEDKQEKEEKRTIKDEKNNEQYDKTLEMELLHNAITAQLNTMISTHSYIAQSSYHELEDDNNIWNSKGDNTNEGLGSNLKGKPGRPGSLGNLRNFINSRRLAKLANNKNSKVGKLGKPNHFGRLNNSKNSGDNEKSSDLNGAVLLTEENVEGSQDVQSGLEINKEKINSIKNDMLNNTNKNNNSNNINSIKYELNNSVTNTNHIKLNQDKGNDLDNWSATGSASSLDFDMDVDTTTSSSIIDNFDGTNDNENTFVLTDDNKLNELNSNTTDQTKDILSNVKPQRIRPKHYKKKYSLRKQLDDGTCICYYYGKKLVGNQGEVRVAEVLSFNDNLYTFSNMLEVKNILQINSNRLHYCPLHCCFVTVWKDAMDQTRIMYHQIERFIDFKSFNNMVIRFRNDWPNAIKLHNNYAHSIDATEGARMFAQTNRALTDCFMILLNLQKAINDALLASLSLAIRALTDASQEKNLINRLFLINKNMEVSGETVRNSLLFANEILFPFGALHDEATPPLSDDES